MKWGDIMTLIEILSEIPDFRKDKGKRHPLSAILALACVATMCGCKTYSAIAQWGRNYDPRFTKALGFIHDKTPCAATFCNVFCNIAIKIMESKLGQWATSIGVSTDVSTSGQEDFQEEAISIDGKTLKGSLKQGSSITHLLSAVSHKSGLTLAQCSVDKETNEIGTIDEILKNLVLEGRIVSVDAMHTQRETSRTIIDGGGDYVMPVKDNQQRLLDDVKTVFEGPCSHLLSMSSAKTLDVGHGRIEERHLTASDALFGYSDWPGLHQVFKIERRFIRKRTGEVHQETFYGITSLTSQKADPERLLSLIRGHWHIENRSHWVRDVTFDEDRSQVRKGNIPEVMSSLRNTVIGLLRYSGETNIASACRRYAAQPLKALELIGISL
jgi:predicted transposase YbfD/YdcC